MIRFTTRNSKYEVTVQKNRFHVKKFEEINPASRRIAVGQTTISEYLALSVGIGAGFGGLRTSAVMTIEDV